MHRYQVGDHVSCNSGAGRVRGRIIKITPATSNKGHTHRASANDRQYGIESDKTDDVAAHKDGTLRKLSG